MQPRHLHKRHKSADWSVDRLLRCVQKPAHESPESPARHAACVSLAAACTWSSRRAVAGRMYFRRSALPRCLYKKPLPRGNPRQTSRCAVPNPRGLQKSTEKFKNLLTRGRFIVLSVFVNKRKPAQARQSRCRRCGPRTSPLAVRTWRRLRRRARRRYARPRMTRCVRCLPPSGSQSLLPLRPLRPRPSARRTVRSSDDTRGPWCAAPSRRIATSAHRRDVRAISCPQLHTTAAYYPETASPSQQTLAEQFIRSLGELYACSHCAADFRSEVEASPPRRASAPPTAPPSRADDYSAPPLAGWARARNFACGCASSTTPSMPSWASPSSRARLPGSMRAGATEARAATKKAQRAQAPR